MNPRHTCSRCGAEAPAITDTEILLWGEGGTMAHFVTDDPLMFQHNLVCPECQEKEAAAEK